ncbi:hypothetical protein [Xanthomonas phage JGB6]|nr:hypothetical protein [Xanthomonas phage JGB6]
MEDCCDVNFTKFTLWVSHTQELIADLTKLNFGAQEENKSLVIERA